MIKYRPEIDGLRTIAVVAVILYHAEFLFGGHDPFIGGFLGVDIFFVISGYLITLIILRELREGRFSFWKFYERRVRRILPILFVVMLASIPFAWMYMLPKSMTEYSGSVLSSIFFSSNFWFWLEDSYWAGPSALKPFLHTWSLSVEEQYYLVIPTVLIVLWRYGRRFMLEAFLLLAAVSLIFAHIYSSIDPSFTFFLLPARMWELLAGSILAKIEFDRGRAQPSALMKNAAPLIGMAMILVPIGLMSKQTLHPSFYTLVPIIGVMLIIRYGGNGDPVSKVLSSRPFVAIGLISYGFYLWHFPIFAFSRIREADPTNLDKVWWIALSLVLSVVSYFLIEKPARNRKKIRYSQVLSGLAVALAVLIGFNVFSLQTHGTLNRFTPAQLKFLNLDRTYGGDFTKYVRAAHQANGEAYKDNGKPRLLLIGDSFSQDLFNMLNETGVADDYDIGTHLVRMQCRNVAFGTAGVEETIKPDDRAQCADQVRIGDPRLDDRIRAADGVIVASNWDEYTSLRASGLVEAIRATGQDNILIMGTKNFSTVETAELLAKNGQELLEMRKPMIEERATANVRLKRDFGDIFVDYEDLACDGTPHCPVATPDGFLISYDNSHLTQEGARYLGEQLKAHPVFQRFRDRMGEAN